MYAELSDIVYHHLWSELVFSTRGKLESPETLHSAGYTGRNNTKAYGYIRLSYATYVFGRRQKCVLDRT